MTKVKVAVAWLRKEDWKRWQEIDDQLPPYERWFAKIEGLINQAETAGQMPTKIDVDPESFLAWCKATGKPVHRDTRAQYAAQILMSRLTAH
jgi:hypothetical protein